MLHWSPTICRGHTLAVCSLGNKPGPTMIASLGCVVRRVYSTIQGKNAEAGILYPRAITILEKKLGPEHLTVATAVNNWAQLLKSQVKDVSVSIPDATA